MNFLKIYLYFHLSYWLRLLLIVCGDIESILYPSSDRSIRVLYSNICGLHANLNSTRGAQGRIRWCPLYVREVFRSFQQSKLQCSWQESCVVRISSRIINIYVYAFYHNPGHDSSLFDCLFDFMVRVKSVDDKAVFVFVDDANAHHSKWLELVSSSD